MDYEAIAKEIAEKAWMTGHHDKYIEVVPAQIAAILRAHFPEPAPAEQGEGDIVTRLLSACNGHPFAKMPWPHRLLHDAVKEIEALRPAARPQPKEPQAEGSGELDADAKEVESCLKYLYNNFNTFGVADKGIAALKRLAARPAPTNEKALKEALEAARDALGCANPSSYNQLKDAVITGLDYVEQALTLLDAEDKPSPESAPAPLCRSCVHRNDGGCAESVADDAVTQCTSHSPAPTDEKALREAYQQGLADMSSNFGAFKEEIFSLIEYVKCPGFERHKSATKAATFLETFLAHEAPKEGPDARP